MENADILVVDDDLDLSLLLERLLKDAGYSVRKSSNAHGARKWLKTNRPKAVLCDYRLPDGNGIDVLHEVHEIDADIPVVLMTGYSDVRLAVSALKQGAADFLTKPLQPDEILGKMKRLVSEAKPKKAPKRKKTDPTTSFIDGISNSAKRQLDQIKLVAPSPLSVLIQGETGTGKEYVARRIHLESERRDGPFVAIDCGALSSNIAAGELFGYEKGAFTGAAKRHKGCFEQAQGGTLFLDEIGNLSYENQMRLLRVLQERVVRRLGGTEDIKVDVRIVTATNEELTEAMTEGEFREDIYHRLNEFPIRTVPLRERSEDLPLFAEHFLERANEQLKRKIKSFDPEAMNKLLRYPWPGNLRELRNVVTRTVLTTAGDTIHSDDLPAILEQPMEHHGPEKGGDKWQRLRPLKEVVANAERRAILTALEFTGNNRTRAAAILDIDRRTLYNKLRDLQIDEN